MSLPQHSKCHGGIVWGNDSTGRETNSPHFSPPILPVIPKFHNEQESGWTKLWACTACYLGSHPSSHWYFEHPPLLRWKQNSLLTSFFKDPCAHLYISQKPPLSLDLFFCLFVSCSREKMDLSLLKRLNYSSNPTVTSQMGIWWTHGPATQIKVHKYPHSDSITI